MTFFSEVTASNKFDDAKDIPRHPLTGISVLIVGAGPVGLYTALEGWRKGHNVRIIERTPGPSTAGDFFTIGPSIVRHIQKNWPAIFVSLDKEPWCIDPWVSFHKITGERMAGPEPWLFNNGQNRLTEDGEPGPSRIYRALRPKFTAALLGQAYALGIEVTFDKRAVDYFEDETKAGVVLEGGMRMEADVVVAADGVGTRSHKLVNGRDIRAMKSGYSIFRAAYPVEYLTADEQLDKRFPLREDGGTVIESWNTDDLSFFVNRNAEVVSWAAIHRDIAGTSAESWGNHVSADKVIEFLRGFPEIPEYLKRLVKTAPADAIVDWQILWRDPQLNWTSPLARVVQVGDAAHTFVPASGNGVVQGMEDAITLATCLQLGGNLKTGMCLKVHNKLRFERVSCAQLLGFINQSHYLKPEWGQQAAHDASNVKPEYGWWIWGHNPEQYAYDNYGRAFVHLMGGTLFQSTNIPRGYTYEPWNLEKITRMLDEGKKLKFEGDWS